MTRKTLRERVLDHEFSETRYSTFINDMLNEAERKIARRANLRAYFDTETVTTVSGTASYALPSDYARLFSLTYTAEDTPLQNITVEDYDDLPTANSSGTPTAYTIDRPNLKLYPTPDVVIALQLRYYHRPPEMDGDTDQPELPEDWQHLLVTYALARCYRRENDLNQATAHMNEFDQDLAEMMADLQQDAQDATQPQQVGGVWTGGRGITMHMP